MLVVRGKGGKERLVPLNEAAKLAMADNSVLIGEASKDAKASQALEMAVPFVRRRAAT